MSKSTQRYHQENTILKKWTQIRNTLIESTKRCSKKAKKTSQNWFDAECKAELYVDERKAMTADAIKENRRIQNQT